MKLIGKLKKQVEQTGSRDEAREVIKKAGMLLDDDELDQVSGGLNGPMGLVPPSPDPAGQAYDPNGPDGGAPAPSTPVGQLDQWNWLP